MITVVDRIDQLIAEGVHKNVKLFIRDDINAVILELPIAFVTDPIPFIISMQHSLSLQAGAEVFAAYLIHGAASTGKCHECSECQNELINSAKAASLLHHTMPVEASSFSRRKAINIFRGSLKDGSIRFITQPIMDLHTYHVIGYELLVRILGKSGYLKNSDWIGHIVQSHDSIALAKRAIKEATSRIILIKSDTYLSINLTSLDLSNKEVLKELNQVPLSIRKRMVLELTEWQGSGNSASLRNSILSLKKLGYKIALDDFGCEYSSLPTFRAYPFDIVKIDMSLTHSNYKPDHNLLRIVADLGKEAGVKVVAEGIDTLERACHILSCGIEYGQGFWLDQKAV